MLRSLYVVLALNTVLAYVCIAAGFLEPSAVLSVPMLREVYYQALETVRSIPPGPPGFAKYVYLQLQSVGGSVVLAAVTVFSSSLDIAVDSLLRGVYMAQNAALDPRGLVSTCLDLTVGVFSNVLALSAASAIGIELWRALLLRSRISRDSMLFLIELVAAGMAIQCLYLPAISAFTP